MARDAKPARPSGSPPGAGRPGPRGLAERDDELSMLAALLPTAGRRRGHVAMLSGPVGYGKSSLLDAVIRRADAAGVRTLSAIGSRDERDLPLGVIEQLVRRGDLRASRARETHRLIARIRSGRPADSRGIRALGVGMIGLATGAPLLIAVDDMHHADTVSLRCLLYVARRCARTPILIALTENGYAPDAVPFIDGALLRLTHCRHVRLRPLSPAAVAAMLAERFGDLRATALAPTAYELTGGNPHLVTALLDDLRSVGHPDELSVRGAFAGAVIGSLVRDHADTYTVARSLAIVGRDAPTTTVARVADLTTDDVDTALDVMRRSGLARGTWFPHPVFAAAVRRSMPPECRADLHGRAARIRHEQGAPDDVVASHLLLTDAPGEAWMYGVLRRAAARCTVAGDFVRALDLLHRAEGVCVDDRQRALLRLQRACVTWWVTPRAGTRALTALAGQAASLLTDRHAGALMEALLWTGELGAALGVFGDLLDRPRAAGRRADETLAITWLWLSGQHPTEARAATAGVAALDRLHDGALDPRVTATAALARTLERGGREAAARAERVLRRGRLGATAAPAGLAIAALLDDDRVEAAAVWADRLIAAAGGRSPLARATAGALRGAVAARQGLLEEARGHTRQALVTLPATHWGVMVALPLSTLVYADAATGRLDDARAHLDVPVPPAAIPTPAGVRYLYAHGCYHFAAQEFETAADNFEACGETIGRGFAQRPAMVPWRSAAGHAYLRLGDPARARRLAEAQLAVGAGHPGLRGAALRLLAATRDPDRRLPLLREAADAVHATGLRLDLAYTFADLADTHHELGEHSQATMMRRRAAALAHRCGARPLLLRLGTMTPAAAPPGPAPAADRIADLTEAERRVAALAAAGDTNRQIAEKLFITTGTVEQHLTRAYRKLNIRRRADLPFTLTDADDDR